MVRPVFEVIAVVEGCGEQTALGGPKLRQFAPLQPSHPQTRSCPPPRHLEEPSTANPTASQYFCYYFCPNLSAHPLLTASIHFQCSLQHHTVSLNTLIMFRPSLKHKGTTIIGRGHFLRLEKRNLCMKEELKVRPPPCRLYLHHLRDL